jgi:hypothetical protein
MDKIKKLEKGLWLNSKAVLHGPALEFSGEIKIGIKEVSDFNCYGLFKRIIPTRKRGIPIEFLIKEQQHYESACSTFND